jgi:HPt (histidine-containing phosphotransfer) domain-containing protein
MTTNNDMPNGKKIIIQVDSDLEDLIPGFLQNRHRDITAIFDALGRKDYDSIAKRGHTMKGVGGGYGFDAITDIGSAIEQAAKQKDPVKIKLVLKELSNYLQRIEIVFEPG